jgi:protein crumbs
MSFDNSYVKAKINMSVDVTLSFRFRTTLMESVLFAWIGQKSSINQLFTSIELSGGRVVVGYHNVGTIGFINTPVSNNKLNDGSWYKVELTKTNSHLSVLITGSKCASGCNLDVAYDPTIQTTQDGYFGSVLDATSLQKTVSKTKYVGCMEDITVWGTRLSLDIVNANHTFVNLTRGCPRTQQCFPDTCNYNGSCIDLWNEYKCDCYRPNLGLTCDTGIKLTDFILLLNKFQLNSMYSSYN